MPRTPSNSTQMASLGGPTDAEATQAMFDLLSGVAEPLEPDSYLTAVPGSSSPPALTPNDILQSLALLQQQDHAFRPSSASYHPQPTRSGRAPVAKPGGEAEEAAQEGLDAYIEFPSDSESDDPDFQPRSQKAKGKRKAVEVSSPSEEEEDEEEEEEEGEFMIEEDGASGDDEVVKSAAGRPAPSRSASYKLASGSKTPPRASLPPQKRVALADAYSVGPISAAPPSVPPYSPGSPRVKSFESVPVKRPAARKPAAKPAAAASEGVDPIKKRKKALANKINYEKKKLDKLPSHYPKSWERKHQELVVANLELQKRNEELVNRLQALGETVEADVSVQTWA